MEGSLILVRVGELVHLAADRFITVAETIADESPEIKKEMYKSCQDVTELGARVESLCRSLNNVDEPNIQSIIQASRNLLSSITKILLLADITLVRKLLLLEDVSNRTLKKFECVKNYMEFVRAFSQFGSEMIDLSNVTKSKLDYSKNERRSAQMFAAKQVLERSGNLLLTSSILSMKYPDCPLIKENKDTVFCQMRRAMDLIHYIVRDSVCDEKTSNIHLQDEVMDQEDKDLEDKNIYAVLNQFEILLKDQDWSNISSKNIGCARLCLAIVVERIEDLTNNHCVCHKRKRKLLFLSSRFQYQFQILVEKVSQLDLSNVPHSTSSQRIFLIVESLQKLVRTIKHQLSKLSFEQAEELILLTESSKEAIIRMKNCAVVKDTFGLRNCSNTLYKYIDYVIEAFRVFRHLSVVETFKVMIKFTEINLKIYGPQVLTAANTLTLYPASKTVKDNLKAFTDMWDHLMTDVLTIAKDVMQLSKDVWKTNRYIFHHQDSREEEKEYIPNETEELQRRGLLKPFSDTETIPNLTNFKMEKPADAKSNGWKKSSKISVENNDIIKRAKNMSYMAFTMYQFTRGEGPLKNTQDLFTQAEYFAEEANGLYKVVRQFSYQVPTSVYKSELLKSLDHIPRHVQQLQFTVKNPTVGNVATFEKVDNVIQEIRNLMTVISQVVKSSFICASKYDLDFRGLSLRKKGDQGMDGGDGDTTGGGNESNKIASTTSTETAV